MERVRDRDERFRNRRAGSAVPLDFLAVQAFDTYALERMTIPAPPARWPPRRRRADGHVGTPRVLYLV